MTREHDLGAQLQAIWDDQRAFNLLFRPQPRDEHEMAEQTRDYVLWTESELHELLKTLPWKKHRKTRGSRFNPAHTHEEGTDVFKFIMSLLQCIGINTLEDLINEYWRKTAVVRQRYQEEWVQKLDGSCVIVDIDNVICDYIRGCCAWLRQARRDVWGEEVWPSKDVMDRIDHLERTGEYINAESLGIRQETWQRLKHQFRTEGAKRHLPVFPDAMPFLFRMRADGHQIVLLTSRPVDTYPNIYTDTILWLNESRLPYDFVWWSVDKAERIVQIQDLQSKIRFAVDDDLRFVKQFADLGIKTYWLQRAPEHRAGPIYRENDLQDNITIVHTLLDVDQEFT